MARGSKQKFGQTLAKKEITLTKKVHSKLQVIKFDEIIGSTLGAKLILSKKH